MQTMPTGPIQSKCFESALPSGPAAFPAGMPAISLEVKASGTAGGGSPRNFSSSASRLSRGSGSGRSPLVTSQPSFPNPVATFPAPHVFATSRFLTAAAKQPPSPHSSALASSAGPQHRDPPASGNRPHDKVGALPRLQAPDHKG